jgi:hypothetical protein
MSIFTKIFHHIIKKEEELLGVNNAKRIYSAWKRWQSHSEPSDDRPLKVACALNDSSHGLYPNRVAQTPVTPLAEMKIARTPGKIEVLPPTAEVLRVHPPPQTQNSTPVNVIDVQPEKPITITKESADQGKDFF